MIEATRLLLVAALAGSGIARAEAPALEMRVEEPSAVSAPPIDPEREAAPWKAGRRKSGPTRHERTAMEERRKQVKAMAEEIRARRMALESAEEGEREGRIKDLQDHLLNPADSKETGADRVERLDDFLGKKTQAAARQLEKKQSRLVEKLEKALEKQEEAREKALEKQEKAQEKQEKLLEKQEREAGRKDKTGKGKPGK
jgi:hypothetical protein